MIEEGVDFASPPALQNMLHGVVVHVFLSHLPFQMTLTESQEFRGPTHFTSQHLASTDDIVDILLPLVGDSKYVGRHCSWGLNPVPCNQKGVR